MAIKKLEFYEGAALHLLARNDQLPGLAYRHPFFVLEGRSLALLLKYSTRKRSPWGFTVTRDEQIAIANETCAGALGLICGSDGVATITFTEYKSIAPQTAGSLHISCSRNHGQHYSVSGPRGALDRKIPPSAWTQVLNGASQ